MYETDKAVIGGKDGVADACKRLRMPRHLSRHVFVSAVGSLEWKGLAQGAWTEEHDLDDARITRQGKVYLAQNPTLRNPVDWKWAVVTVIVSIAAVAGVVALFVSCSLLNN